MKVLVTGGGFIGCALARRLLADGHAVRILDLQPATPAAALQDALRDGAAEWHIGDIGRFDDIAAALAGCSHVVHLAALLTPACRHDPLRGAQVNLLGTLHVFEAARQAGLRHVVYASSAGVFGPDSATQPAPATLYGTWKLAAEGIARSYHADHGMVSVGLRPFVVYGAGRESGVSSGPSQACRAAVRGEPYTIPFSGRAGLVHVDDVVRGFAAALAPRRPGAHVFDLPGVIVDMQEVAAEIARQQPGARIAVQGPPLGIAADIPNPELTPVLGLLPTTSLAEGIAATLAACRGQPRPAPGASMIHELTTLEIKVFSNAKVYAALQRELPEAGGELLGVFASDIGALSRVLVLRAFASANEQAEARLKLLRQRDPLGCGEWLVDLQSESHALFPFLPAVRPAKLGRWYEFRSYSLRQGTLAETIAAWQEAVPARHALSPLVGAFTALDGPQPRFLNVWAYDSLDERARVRAEAVQKGLWPPKGGPANLVKMESTVCAPVAFSPLQ